MQDQSTELVSCAKPDGAVAIEDMDCIGLCIESDPFFMGKLTINGYITSGWWFGT